MRRLVLLLLALGCKPELGAPASLVERAEILAVRGDPAEVAPGQAVAYRLLVASPEGTADPSAAAWALCTQPKPLTENNVVATACLSDDTAPLDGPMGTIPTDACARFGPDVPPTQPGQPPLRPRDPDITGGYYQPVRVTLDQLVAFGLERITCNLANAPVDIAIEYRTRYQPNQNPTLAPLSAQLDGRPVALDAIPAGARVELTVGWTPESVEIFPVFDLATQTLVDHRESMRVSWFATAGRFDDDRTGRTETESETTTSNHFSAPTPGPIHLWVVLRDSRGGTDFASYDLIVVE